MAKKKDSGKKNLKTTAAEKEPQALSPPPSALTDRETRNKVLKVVMEVFIVFIIVMAMIWAKTYHSQQKFYQEGEAALKAHNYKEAMTGYEWAIRMYTPFSGKVGDSCKKLWFIGQEYEKRRKLDWALIAYRGLRSSIYATKSFYIPYEEWIPKTDAKIAKILKAQEMKKRAESARKRGKS